ncbi:hypothetical protein BC939DRAFT_529281 [Gamsiella multidivaricata]|uniref:uncharacterized protein n=1 Tax=Gamsiella multidivaricata TaxID=101098 RepID=UPI0022201A07|nr:uncharacterized protein BC939DRAFT_529281 [Gamsiella multidivaricata]KAI7822877.1 hypothetical protein BC939DRAFT_529281 [Gamsiella multidivaricata]
MARILVLSSTGIVAIPKSFHITVAVPPKVVLLTVPDSLATRSILITSPLSSSVTALTVNYVLAPEGDTFQKPP